MKEELETAFSWLSIITAAAYTFTLGYLDVLKIPINPSPFEALLFYLRATLISSNLFWSVFVIFSPLIIIYAYIKIAKLVLKPKETKQSFCKRLSKELLFFLLGVCLLSAWCALSFNHGKDSLSSEKSESFFPEAYMNSKYEKTYRLAWITGENFFWLDCNEIQPQLIGVRNDIQFYIRRLGANAINTICSKSN